MRVRRRVVGPSQSMSQATTKTPRSGFGFALAAYVVWGAFPLYFKALHPVSASEILAHRILWSAVFLALLVTATRRWPEFRLAFRSIGSLRVYALSTTLVTVNWLLYIWAVGAGRVLETSLGYFINPLINVLLGVVFLQETLRARQKMALAFASAGVLVLGMKFGTFPWLSLALALSFGGYGLVRKKAHIDPVVGLLVETSLVTPLALAVIIVHAAEGTGGLGIAPRTTILLLLAGVITATPLIWFAHGVRSLRLSTMGLLQYITPTLQFLFAVILFREPFTRTHALAYGLIWGSLALYSADALAAQREAVVPPVPRAI